MSTAIERRASFEAMQAATVKPGGGPAPRPLHDPVLPCEQHWIEIECIRDDGMPMADQPYVLRRASGASLGGGQSELRGRTDQNGWVRFIRVDDGADYLLEFPGLDDEVEVRPMYPAFWSDVEAARAVDASN